MSTGNGRQRRWHKIHAVTFFCHSSPSSSLSTSPPPCRCQVFFHSARYGFILSLQQYRRGFFLSSILPPLLPSTLSQSHRLLRRHQPLPSQSRMPSSCWLLSPSSCQQTYVVLIDWATWKAMAFYRQLFQTKGNHRQFLRRRRWRQRPCLIRCRLYQPSLPSLASFFKFMLKRRRRRRKLRLAFCQNPRLSLPYPYGSTASLLYPTLWR